MEQLRRSAAALCDFAMKDLDHLACELVPVHDELSQAFRMENHMHCVIRKSGFHFVCLTKSLEQTPGRLVADAHLPTTVNDNSRIRLLLQQNEIECLAHMLQIIGRQS